MSVWPHFPFEELVQSRGSGASGLPQSEWAFDGRYPVIGQGAEDIEGWSDRDDLVIAPRPAVVLYGGHTRRAKYVDRPFVPGPNVKILESSAELDPKFLYHYLTQLKIESRGYADHFPEVRRRRIPLPPVAEQRRIAEILDKADALRAKRRAALAQLDTLTQSIFLDMFGDPATNPKGWPVQALDALGDISTGKTPPTKNEGMFGGEVPFATPGDLDVSLEFTQRTITSAGAAFTRVVRAGSALVGCIGNIGKMAKTPVETAFNQQINAVEWGDAIDDDYGIVALAFAVPQMIALASSTTVPILNKSGFCKVTIPVPPPGLQGEFASRISAMRRLRLAYRALLAQVDALFASVQYRAFRGDL